MSQNLADKAMLVKLSISKWSARKHDKKVSKEVAQKYGTDQERGRYNKVLIAQEAIKKIGQAESAARTFHYDQTLPWKDDGARILPSANYLHYTQEIRRFKADFEAQVRAFIANYPDLIEDARRELNGLFDPADYPDLWKIDKKFAFEVEVDPLPTAADFRVNLQGEEVNRIKGEIEDRLGRAQADAMKDLFNRLHDVVKHMAEKLADKSAIFRDTLVTNIQELVDLLPRLNLTGDPRLEELRRDVADRLLGYGPEDLRKNQFARQETAQAANDILAAMAGYTNAA
jgi:hypothetical protein